MATVTLALHAMATRFELVLHGEDPVALRAAGEEALAEIERLEAQLSLFRPSSEIAHLNARAAREPVRVTPEVMALLQRAAQLTREGGGAFDITIAPLVRCWGFMGASGRLPSVEERSKARATVGMHLVELNPAEFTVRFARPGVMLDLGAIGKGYAVEKAAELLRENGVTSALLHGGTSTVYGLGHPPEAEIWAVAIPHPRDMTDSQRPEHSGKGAAKAPSQQSREPCCVVPLRDEALSVSAIWGKFFESDGAVFGHIIDPRSGEPSKAAVLAAVALPTATETDALSTALLTLGVEGHKQISSLRPEIRTLVVGNVSGRLQAETHGLALLQEMER